SFRQVLPSQLHVSLRSPAQHSPVQQPPNSTSPPPGCTAMPASKRPGGRAGGCCSVQVVPSKAHMFARSVYWKSSKSRPPKRTTRPEMGSNEAAGFVRLPGTVGGSHCVHVVPSHLHVS